MTNPARALGLGALLLVLDGCATTKARPPVHGRTVEVRCFVQENKKESSVVKGELLAVGADRLFLLSPGGVRMIPREEIEQVRVKLHGLDGQKAGGWALLGGLVTAGALAGACASVEDAENCGGVFAGTAFLWGVIGLPAALDLGKSSRVLVRQNELDTLRPYARYPQGLQEGLDPARLFAAPGQAAAGGAEPSARGTPRM